LNDFLLGVLVPFKNGTAKGFSLIQPVVSDGLEQVNGIKVNVPSPF